MVSYNITNHSRSNKVYACDRSLLFSLLCFILLDGSKDATIIFLVDTSRNNGHDNIVLQLEFVISVASTLFYENIGVIAYSTDAHFVAGPGNSSNFTDFAQTLRTFSYTMGIMTNVGKALDKAKEEAQLFSSSKAAIIVVLVAWKSNDELGIPAFELKNSSVNIIALGLGSNYLVADLYLLASDPEPDHILTVQFGDLKTFVTVTRDKIYQGVEHNINCSTYYYYYYYYLLIY